MTNMMTALVKSAAAPGLWMEHRPVPEIGPDDVLIRIRKTGICGTDVHMNSRARSWRLAGTSTI